MFRIVFYLLVIAAIAAGFSWLADRPGEVEVYWQGFRARTSVYAAVVALSLAAAALLVVWNILKYLWFSPAMLGRFLGRRRQERGMDALSAGMIAIGSGDRGAANRFALQARRQLPNEPMTHLLRAQSAQLSGDKVTARRIFEAMLSAPDTEQLGLRGLYLEAEREGEHEAAFQFAERALRLNPNLEWSANAVFLHQCKVADWENALQTLALAKRHRHSEPGVLRRRRAVLLTAQAREAEDHDPEKALTLALEAQKAAPDLVPAAVIAGRILASRGNTARATRIIQKTWRHSPHPDLATVAAYARIGDSPRDRLARVEKLVRSGPQSDEGPIAIAAAAVEAQEYKIARQALAPLIARPSQRVCTLMARIDGRQHNDRGRVREWLARAVNAPRDPAWTADGIVSDTWAPTSPVTGELDAFQWRVPVERLDKGDAQRVAKELEKEIAYDRPAKSLINSEPEPDATIEQPLPVPAVVTPPDIPTPDSDPPFETPVVTPLSTTSHEDEERTLQNRREEIVVTTVSKQDNKVESVSVTLPPPTNPLDDPNYGAQDVDAPPLMSDTAPLNQRMRSKRRNESAPTADSFTNGGAVTDNQTEVLPPLEEIVAPPLPDDPGPEELEPDDLEHSDPGPDGREERTTVALRYPKRPLP